MRQILFHFAGHPIPSYTAMLYLGTVLGIYAAMFAARASGVSPARQLAATLLLFSFALFGARLLYVAPRWRRFTARPATIFDFGSGGASMYGGLLLAFPASVALLPALEIEVLRFWDLASFTILTGMIVTRAGCFLNGCCSGRPTTSWFGIDSCDYRGVRTRRIPMQLLEAALGGALLCGAAFLWRREPVNGTVFLFAVGAYGAGRFLLEPWRDHQECVHGIRVQRAISLGLVVSSLVGATALVWWS